MSQLQASLVEVRITMIHTPTYRTPSPLQSAPGLCEIGAIVTRHRDEIQTGSTMNAPDLGAVYLRRMQETEAFSKSVLTAWLVSLGPEK